jgi:hypothetical protein
MLGKRDRWWAALALLLPLVLPGAGRAGPYFGEWSWCWKPARDCPCGEYCCLHYYAPTLYRVKYCCHRAYLDQYPPGLPVPVGWRPEGFPCRTAPPVPDAPYADPAGFYQRQVIPPPGEEKKEDTKEKK